MIRRVALLMMLALSAMLPAAPALASGHAVEGAEVYAKMQPIVLEMWDENGVFHQIAIELSMVSKEPSNVPKAVSMKIKQALQALPFEELQKGESTALVKRMALDFVHKETGGAAITDILITKMMFK